MSVSMLLNPFRNDNAENSADMAAFSPTVAERARAFHASFSQYRGSTPKTGEAGSTPKTGASPFIGQFFRQVSDQFTSHFSSTKRAHAGGSFRSCGSHTHAAGSTSFSDENLL